MQAVAQGERLRPQERGRSLVCLRDSHGYNDDESDSLHRNRPHRKVEAMRGQELLIFSLIYCWESQQLVIYLQNNQAQYGMYRLQI